MDKQSSLIDRIEQVKSKIIEFESSLGISAIDIDRIVPEKNKELAKQVRDYKNRIDRIEKEVTGGKAENYPVESSPLLQDKNAEKVHAQKIAVENPIKAANANMEDTVEKIKKEAEEVESINKLLEKLKRGSVVSSNGAGKTATAAVPPQKRFSDVSASVKTRQVTGAQNHIEQSNNDVTKKETREPAASSTAEQNTRVTENDLHAMSELISKLDELLRSNREIADKLYELLKTKDTAAGKSGKSSDLIRKLALLGTGGQSK